MMPAVDSKYQVQNSGQSVEISRDEIARTIARLDELNSNLKEIHSRMDELSVDAISLEGTAPLSQCCDTLIQFVSQAGQKLSEQPRK